MSMNIYQIVTDRIIEQLENNVIAWHRQWQGGQPLNYITQKPYQGINLLLLPYGGEWLTFKQVQEVGGTVRKGEKSSMIVFFKMLEKDGGGDADSAKEKFPLLRYSNVFHLSQTEDIESKQKSVELNNVNPIEQAETALNDYIARSGVRWESVRGSNEAYYSPSLDKIVMPAIKQFTSSEDYYSVAFHEAAHSSGHQSRLDRISKDASFGNKEYSKEELVAEISACMTMNYLNLEIPDTFDNSVAYINAWRKKLKDDNKLILTAANHAQKATNLILGMTQDLQLE